jgi:hypothetical protein
MVGGDTRGMRIKWYARHASADVCRKHHELVYDFHALNTRVNISSDAPQFVFERPFATERKNLQCEWCVLNVGVRVGEGGCMWVGVGVWARGGGGGGGNRG